MTLFEAVGTAEVIYDNTQFPLNGYATETREYGDQLDLEGTARTLTELTFMYYGNFTATGDEAIKVRIYSNETPYDLYRNSPTRLLYESGNMPMSPGYNTRTIKNLTVKLPLDTITFAIECKGILTNEFAGLLLYGPPTVGWSFNELWGRTPNGGWESFFYSRTDYFRRANAAIKLVARTETVNAAQQTGATDSLPLQDSSGPVRFAQTFIPTLSGRLDSVQLSLNSTGAVEVAVLNTMDGKPGLNVLGRKSVSASEGGTVNAQFYDLDVYLKSGEKYALEIRETTNSPAVGGLAILCSKDNTYEDGELWTLDSRSNQWYHASIGTNNAQIDAAFSVAIDPSAPPVRITTPPPGALIPYGTTVRIGAELKLPAISTLWRVRFFDGDQELEQLLGDPPYEIFWKATNSGPHTIRVVCEDTFLRPFRAESHTVTVLEATVPSNLSVEIARKDDGSVRLGFDSILNKHIKVQYSDDCANWKTATTEAVGTGSRISYTDDGPPKTERHPTESEHRFYRVIFSE